MTISLLLALLFFGGPSLYERVERDVQPLYRDAEGAEIACTVFRVEHRLVTAAHCFDGDQPRYLEDGIAVRPEVVVRDFAMLHGSQRRRGLELQKRRLKPGNEIVAFGYAFGDEPMEMKFGRVAGKLMKHPRDGKPIQRFDVNTIGGMSGGPITTKDGKVVSMNMSLRSWHSSGTAYGLPQELFIKVFSIYR